MTFLPLWEDALPQKPNYTWNEWAETLDFRRIAVREIYIDITPRLVKARRARR